MPRTLTRPADLTADLLTTDRHPRPNSPPVPIAKVTISKKDIVRGELPVDDRYELPMGVEWKNVCHDIIDYGLFAHHNCIYARRANGKGKSGTEQYRFIAVTNFTIRILQHMEDEERPMYLVSLHNVHGRKRTFDCLTDDMSSSGNFRKLCLRYGNFDFKGQPADFDRLLGYLMDKMGEGSIINELGWQGYDGGGGWFAFANAAVNGEVREYDKYGCIEIDGQHYYIPAGNSIYKRNAFKFEAAKLIHLHQNDIDFRTWAALMYKVHREHSMMAICFGMATLFSDHIYKHEHGFPMLYFYGEPGTGKNELISAVQTLYGKPQAKISLTGKANTDKGKLRMFAEHVNIPLFLDEYRNTLPDEMFEMLKGIWDRTGYKRGNITSRYGTDSVPIRCTAFVAGNYYPNADDALLTRFIVDPMEKSAFTADDKKRFAELQAMMHKGYSGILVELLRHRTEFEAQYNTISAQVRGDVDTRIGLKISTDRMLRNISVLGAVYRFFEKRLQWPFTYNQLLEYMIKVTLDQEQKRDQGNDVAHFWDCFLSAVKNHKLKNGTDFKIDGDVLSMFWKPAYIEYVNNHYQLYRANGQSSTSILDKLRKSTCWIGPVDAVHIGKRKSSAYQFKLSGINEDIIGLILDIGDFDSSAM